jgi:hypothetical protein
LPQEFDGCQTLFRSFGPPKADFIAFIEKRRDGKFSLIHFGGAQDIHKDSLYSV